MYIYIYTTDHCSEGILLYIIIPFSGVTVRVLNLSWRPIYYYKLVYYHLRCSLGEWGMLQFPHRQDRMVCWRRMMRRRYRNNVVNQRFYLHVNAKGSVVRGRGCSRARQRPGTGFDDFLLI